MLKKILAAIICMLIVSGAFAQKRALERLPYIDQRKIHFGFLVGTHVQDLAFTHSGYVSESGESWYSEIPSFSPGFNVGLVGDLYLCEYLNLRFTPNMYFGNKTVEMRNALTDERVRQDIKSNYLSFPLLLRYSAKRINNYRPYITAGASAMIDLSKRKNDYLQLKTFDGYIEVGFGCDIYLSYFKLIPELKFCFGLGDVLQHTRKDLRDPLDIKYTQGLRKINSRMVVLTFYFE